MSKISNKVIGCQASLGWVGRLVGNTALGEGHLDVTLVTPAGTPGVLDENVVSSLFGTVANSEDTVVKSGSASGFDDTTGVHLEGRLIGFNGNGDWSLGNGSLELGSRWGDIFERFDLTNTLAGFVLAGTLLGLVSIFGFKHEWGFLDVLEGVVHETTIAALVNLVAVNELLLGEGLELSGLLEHSTFNGTGGGESPA